MGAGLSGNERGRQEQRKQEAKRGTKSPRDCMLKMSVVTQTSEAGEGTPDHGLDGLRLGGRVCQSR